MDLLVWWGSPSALLSGSSLTFLMWQDCTRLEDDLLEIWKATDTTSVQVS